MSVTREPDAPGDYRRIGRRELLRLWGPAVLAGAAIAGGGATLHGRPGRHQQPAESTTPLPPDWRVAAEGPAKLAVAGGSGPVENLRRALAAVGGIERFVGRGHRVAIKPNCAWDRTPEQAANTNPELVAELARLCLAAGAASVTVVDNTCHDPARTFARSGIAAAARAAGAAVAHQGNTATERRDLGGLTLGTWEVLRPIVEADRLINVPIVKHHSLPGATLGMKNWFGAVVGARPSLHQQIARVCAELGAAFNPTLTVMDATRVLAGGGPTGGSLSLVKPMDLVGVATDPVAADAWGASLLELAPGRLPHIGIAEQLGLGSADWRSLLVEV
jgi:uncharacterized protein (DUF362 family)